MNSTKTLKRLKPNALLKFESAFNLWQRFGQVCWRIFHACFLRCTRTGRHHSGLLSLSLEPLWWGVVVCKVWWCGRSGGVESVVVWEVWWRWEVWWWWEVWWCGVVVVWSCGGVELWWWEVWWCGRCGGVGGVVVWSCGGGVELWWCGGSGSCSGVVVGAVWKFRMNVRVEIFCGEITLKSMV